MKRIISLLMAIMLVVTALSGLAVTVAAAEDDVYVLNYNGAYEGAKWQYFSPYWPAFELDGADDYTQSISFTLYDTTNADPFWTYCTDLEVGLVADSNFRRINLEDSTYAGAAAGVLRSIVLKGYPNTDVADLAIAAGVESLTVGEAVAATQAAIWQTAHGDRVEFTDFCRTIDTDWAEDGTANFKECYAEIESGYAVAENEAVIEANIEKVFNYLINLEATAPTGVVASESSFIEWDSVVTDNGDNTATVTATATVDVTVGDTDSLTLTATVGDYAASTTLQDGEKEYTLVIENVPTNVADDAVTLAISGTQALSDVYLFDAVGARGTSQSLIGITDNALPVYAAVNANDRILILNKHDDGTGLQNIVFDIYYVCSVEEYVTGEVVIGTGTTTVDGVEYFSAPTEEDIAKYVKGLPTATITTDANGQASFNFGNNNDGIYIVVERENDITTGAVSPFFVAIPGGADADNTDNYIVEVDVKNTVKDEDVIIEKDVTEIDNDWSTYDVGETHTWIIQSSIPTGMATGLKYEITDTLNYQLTYVGNVKVTVSEKTAKAGEDLLVLTEGEDYILTVTPGTETVNEVEEDITSFKVALTKTGMEKVAAVEGTEPEVRVYFDAYIDEDAIIATEIPNQAHISYENNVGFDFDKDSDIPVVITGAGQLLKVDASNHDKVLSGATFNVYREATAEEIADETIETVKMEVPVTTTADDGTVTTEMVEKELVQVSFYNNAAMVGEKVTEVVSDEYGKGVIYGLAYGTYYLVETKAPAGYNMLPTPVEMVIDAASYTDAEVVTIYNAAGFQLPSTGGEGTTMFMVVGGVIIAAAMMLIVVPKKKNA